MINETVASGLSAPIFRRPRPNPDNPQLDKDDTPVIQLQACDLVAWEVRRGQIDYLVKRPLRKSLHAVSAIKNRRWNKIVDQDLANRLRNTQIPLRPAWKFLGPTAANYQRYYEKSRKR